MARFYAEIRGNRGSATRMGTPQSGLAGHIRGWNVGVQVYCRVDSNGADTIEVWQTGGSNNPSDASLIATLRGLSS